MKSAFQEFNRIDGRIESIYHEAAVKMGLSDSEFWILYVLVTNAPRLPQPELIEITGMSKTTVNSALKKMEREGIVHLAPGSGRSTCVSLTEAGVRLAEGTVCRLINVENRIFEGWSPEEQRMLIHLNSDYADKLAAQVKAL